VEPIVDPARVVQLAGARLLIVSLGAAHDVLSWAIVNGGRRRASAVVWREVDPRELGPDRDPQALLRRALDDVELPAAVGLLTARDVRAFDDVTCAGHGLWARGVATVGLANALAAGDPPGRAPGAGTINILCQVSCAFTEEALVEACALASEARTAAMVDAHLPSPLSGRTATGTGTDCIVVASPATGPRAPRSYAGKHTPIGALLGAAVREAVARGIARRLEEIRCARP
jgi:adenosylcobinamide amidohydrolase